MCGIAGIYDPRGGGGLDTEIRVMTGRLGHRGPDDEGYYVSGNVALGHKRLSIIDLKTGHQPIFNEDESVCIVYNGEVYNFAELTEELEGLGHRFRTRTDTEAILHAYEEWGIECVKRLRGMFAFAIWDEKNQSLVLARDRLGIKPLFYSLRDGRLAFSSEMKAILSDPGFDRSIDKEALASYFIFSYIQSPLTIYEGIRKLPPGHVMVLKDGHSTVTEYWDIVFAPDRKKSEADFIHEFMELLRESVKLRLVSDVPVGAFLSGGIDSSAVIALMSGEVDSINSFTIGFGGNTGGFEDERKYARLVAERYSTNHREFEVTPVLDGLLDNIITSFDEPFADDATIPSYFISKMARENVKVILSGLGGDEDFCGYERYLGFQLSSIYNRVPRVLRERFIKTLVEKIPEGSSGGSRVNHIKRFVRASSAGYAERYLGFVNRLTDKYSASFFSENGGGYEDAAASARRRFMAHFDKTGVEDPLNKVFYCDIKTYLPEDILACTDRTSMHHSLEVRVPFLDHKLMEYCATIPPELKIRGLKKKYLLKKALKPLLPAEVINHKKQGFVGPMSSWIKNDLKQTVLEKLSRENIGKHGILNPETVGRILDEHFRGRENNDTLIWSLLIFQRWHELYIEDRL